MDEIKTFEKLLNDFKALHIEDVEPEQTFMQLSGYPHYENVCSNLLSFLFDTEEVHGLKDLFALSLLGCVLKDAPLSSCRTERPERECITDKNNRIDIVFETETFTVGIENKLNSDVHNDLYDYDAYITKRAKANEKEPLCILLSLRDNSKVMGKTAFHNVTYSSFIERLKKNLGWYLPNANTKWIIFVNDFIKTLEDLQEETKLDKELIHFFNTHYDDIEKLLAAMEKLQKSLKQKANKIKELVSADNGFPIKQFVYCPKNKFFVEYYITFENSQQIDGEVLLDVWVDTEACYIIAGVRNGADIQKELLEKHFTRNKVSCNQWFDNEVYFQLEKYSIFEPETVIAERFRELLSIILKV